MAEEATELRALVTADDSRGWEAVGRINIGTDSFCTGALIAPDVVLTAAHCLYDRDTHERVGVDQIIFSAGLRNGRAQAQRRVTAAVTHPDYLYQGGEGGAFVAMDIALLSLDRPIQNGMVTPFEVDQKPRKGAPVGVVSYARHRAERPSIQEVCHVLGRPAGTLVMSCDVDFGASGAPVFTMDDGEPRIVSVISAMAEINGRPVSLGTSLGSALTELKAELAAAPRSAHFARQDTAPDQKTLTPIRRGLPTSGTSAKFLRP